MRDEKNGKGATGVRRWGATAGSAPRGRAGRAGRGVPSDARSQIAALLAALVLLVASVLLALPPAEVLGWGVDFAGGTSYSYALADGAADTAATAAAVRSRLSALGVRGARVSSGEGVTVEVPAGQDAADAVAVATRPGRVELVRLDAISDADALARVQAGASGVVLAEGSYEAFLDNSSIASIDPVRLSASSDLYGIQIAFTSEGAEAFAEVTSELAPVGGQVAVVFDGTVVAAPGVSDPITDGVVTVSAGLSLTDAAGMQAAVRTGVLPAELGEGTAAPLAPAVSGTGLLRALVVAGVAALVALLATMRLLGLVAYAGLVSVAVLEVGGLAALSRAGLFVPTGAAYVVAAIVVCATFLELLRVLWRVRSCVRGGTDPRDAGRVALRRHARELAVIAVAFVAGGLALFLLVSEGGLASNPAGLAWPVAAVAGALTLLLVCLPLTRAFSRAMRANPDAWGVAPRDEGDR
ncbi:SecDF P1 head subdomain-containing protein [Thermophilibacter provencensis]|uniref:SecDF P1 head subdomain domain-containing protein n=2 Tax=Thermophilibacter provencensis TaxID=1852386 RepID=A0A921KL67_9ACTN|nr:hypothetical protein [Thermophilibacter provencensis]HJF45100.1 hypothetical protein [Thermophilibacter provencensis]